MKKPQVGIVMGSESDRSTMDESAKILNEFGISCEIVVSSAHRSPQKTEEYSLKAEERGLEVIIAGAGMAAHLAGAIASRTILPVIGVPIPASYLSGMDSLLSTVQMPRGVPVATVAIGKAGAVNAGILAAQILSGKYPEIRKKLKHYKENLANK